VLPTPQSSPDSPDPAVANIAHLVVAASGFRPQRYQLHPIARTPVNVTTSPKKTPHLVCSI
jgi:hypothetical protein